MCGGSGLGNHVLPRIEPAAPRFARLLADVNVDVCKDLPKTPRFPRLANLWPDLESDIARNWQYLGYIQDEPLVQIIVRVQPAVAIFFLAYSMVSWWHDKC